MTNHMVATGNWVANLLLFPMIALFIVRTRVVNWIPVTTRQVVLFFTPVKVPAHKREPWEVRRERLEAAHLRLKTAARPTGVLLAVPLLAIALIGSFDTGKLQPGSALADGLIGQQSTINQTVRMIR